MGVLLWPVAIGTLATASVYQVIVNKQSAAAEHAPPENMSPKAPAGDVFAGAGVAPA